MMHMDQIVNAIVRLVNDSVAPVGADQMRDVEGGPFDMRGHQTFHPVFVRVNMPDGEDRFGADGIHNPGQAGNVNSLFTTRSIAVNPLMLLPGGYNYLALSTTGDRENTDIVQEMIRIWASNNPEYGYAIRVGNNYFNFEDAYNMFITNLGIEIREANTHLGVTFTQVVQADNSRNAIMGVATDEELSNMMTYQFAYQAAARLFNIVDSMIDTLINRTGRVGL
jgi:flagellar hook-associated protein 1 FlgK